MKQSELKRIIKEETAKVLKEKLNFVLGPTIHGDPNKPMKDDFKIAFKDPRKAIMTIMRVNKELQAKGLEPVDYENVGIVFNKPSNQQMQFILNAFNNEDVESVGRVLKEAKHPAGSLGRDMNTTPNPNISRAEYEADAKLWASKALEFEKIKKDLESRLKRTKNADHKETLEGEIEYVQDQIDTFKGMAYDTQRIIKNIK